MLVTLPSLLLAAAAAPQTTVTLIAQDGKCISSVSSDDWNDNRLRAYWSSSAQGYVDGFVKFDLSSIPDGATITSMTLRAYHEAGFGNPFNNPEVIVHRVAGDAWARGQNDVHPGLNEALTSVYANFPVNDLAPVDFVLNVGASTWAADLLDNTLSLALRNDAGTVGRYSYVYFYSSDTVPAPPELIVQYISGPSLNVSNLAAGQTATFTIVGATPLQNVGIALSLAGGGPTAVPSPCGPIVVALSPPLMVLGIVPADPAGVAAQPINVPTGASGRLIWAQALDIGSCQLTNGLFAVVQ